MEVYVEFLVDTVVLRQAFHHFKISTDNYFTSALYSSVAVPEKCERPDQSACRHNLSPYSGLNHNLGLDWTQSK
jgi:hypothetical protein